VIEEQPTEDWYPGTDYISLHEQSSSCMMIILYPEFLALLAKYLCQRLTVLQEFCKMAKFLKYNNLPTSVKYINN
jgi:hypothetical protein